MLWNTYVQSIFRHWPWVIAGVVALIIYPRAEYESLANQMTLCANVPHTCSQEQRVCLSGSSDCQIQGFDILYSTQGSWEEHGALLADAGLAANQQQSFILFQEDREATYPQLIKDLLPAGLLGLMFVSLMAAFMSTISTHINWGASYLTNDVYQRFIHPDADQKRLVWVSRLSTLLVLVLALLLSAHINSIGSMWELAFTLAGGMGLPHLLRWLWWRANAWTEISGMVTAFALGFINLFYFEGEMFASLGASHPFHVISYVSLISGVVCLIVTGITAPVDSGLLTQFLYRVRPLGFWKPVDQSYTAPVRLSSAVLTWALGSASIYMGLFGTGLIVQTQYWLGTLLFVGSSILIWLTYRRLC